MKRVLLLSIIIFICSPAIFANNESKELWEKAYHQYRAADYDGALGSYLQIEGKGLSSKELSYNIGNCYFKKKEYGKALLYFERALKYNPSDKDIIRNIEITKDYTLDRIEVLPEFILRTWIRELNYTLSSNLWAWSGIVLTLSMFVMLLGFRFAPKSSLRKISLILAIVAFTAALSAFSFAWSQKASFNKRDAAIVLTPVASVKSSPDSEGKDLFMLHEGTKVKIIDHIAPWKRVVLSDGRDGWIREESIEVI